MQKKIQLTIYKSKFILKYSDLYKSQLNTYRDEKIQLEKRVWELENDLDAEQFKRDKAELRIDQIKREMSFKGIFYNARKFLTAFSRHAKPNRKLQFRITAKYLQCPFQNKIYKCHTVSFIDSDLT